MKRGFLIFLGIVVTGLAALFVSKHLLQGPPTSWLCHEYALDPGQAERLQLLAAEYGKRCGPYCDAMCEANARLESVTLGSSGERTRDLEPV